MLDLFTIYEYNDCMKCFIYARVSSISQSDNYSYAAQKRDGIAFAESIGADYKLYKDIESGKKSTRLGWKELKQDLESLSEPNDVVWYGSQSRLTRDSLEFQVFMKICIAKKLRLYERTESRYINFAESSGDRIVGGIKAIIASEEVLEINRRTREGKEDSWDAGMRAHSRIYGYNGSTYDEKGNRIWKPVPEEVEVIRKIFNGYEKGDTLYQIVKSLNVSGYRTRYGHYWDNSRVKRTLQHIAYSGRTTDSKGNVISSKKYPAIIEPERFDRIGRIYIKKHSQNTKGRPFFYEGSGIFKCSVCGAGFYVQKVRDRKYYHHKDDTGCDGPKLRKYEICNYILQDAYNEALLNHPEDIFIQFKEEIESEGSKIEQNIHRLDSLIKEAEKEKANFVKAIASGKATDFFAAQVESKLREIAKLQKDRDTLITDFGIKTKSYEDMEAEFSLDNLVAFYDETNTQIKRDLLRRIITNALIHHDCIKVNLLDGREITYPYKEMLSKWKSLDYSDQTTGNVTWKKVVAARLRGDRELKISAIKSIIKNNDIYVKNKKIAFQKVVNKLKLLE